MTREEIMAIYEKRAACVGSDVMKARVIADELMDEFGLHAPYPFCYGNPTRLECYFAGYCRKDHACND